MRSALVAILFAGLAGCGGSDASQPPGANPEDTGAPSDTANADTGVTDTGPVPTGGSIDIIDLPTPIDLSPDGKIAVLEDVFGADTPLYFYDTVSRKLDQKTTVGDPTMNAATGVSSDGRVSAMHGKPNQAGLWSEGSGWLDFNNGDPACDGQQSAGAFDISADGHVLVGINWDTCHAEAFVSSDVSGKPVMTILQPLGFSMRVGKLPSNRGTAISDDGTTIGGFAENGNATRSPAVWNAADGKGFLLTPDAQTGNDMGEVLSLSVDGKTAAGLTNAYVGFVWTKETGLVKMPQLDVAEPTAPMYPLSIAAGGKIVFGKSGTVYDGVEIAFVWTAEKGTRRLQDIVKAAGIEVPKGVQLTHALAASQDGSVVLGTTLDAKGNHQSYVLHLSPDAYLK